MYRRAIVCLVLLLAAAPALAVTNQDGQVLITQAAVNAGNVTPGDTPGFPVTISVGGSYRLASNLVVTTAVNGIEVRANEVSIDMGGFTLAGSGVGRNGIASFNRTLRVQGGNVRGFAFDGVRSIAPNLTILEMVISTNGRYGVFADPSSTTAGISAYAAVSSSSITANQNHGINCGEHCRVESNLISGNGGNGIYFAGGGGLALGNVVTENLYQGIYFFSDKPGGAGNNTLTENYAFVPGGPQIFGPYIPLQPNACNPACPAP